MEQTFVILAKAENALRTLQRMASLLTRNRLKILRIQVSEQDLDHWAQLYLTLRTDENTVEKMIKQLRKMADILEVDLVKYEIKQFNNRRYDYAKKNLFRFS